MNGPVDSLSRVTPSATPSDADIAAWEDLPRDEQLRLLQSRLSHPDCSMTSSADMSDILKRAQAAATLRRG